MTDAKWLAGAEPQKVLLALARDGVSERKRRLFACACCREAVRLIPDDRALRAVEIAERLVDGATTDEEVVAASTGMEELMYEADRDRAEALEDYYAAGGDNCDGWASDDWGEARWHEMGCPLDADLGYRSLEASVAFGAAGMLAEAVYHLLGPAPNWRVVVESACAAAREMKQPLDRQLRVWLSDLFRISARQTPVTAWLSRNEGVARRLAQMIHDERQFEHLPVLADALEDAGCADTELLSHLRGPGPHLRGCWALDLILERT
jgi:hypothetical protein